MIAKYSITLICFVVFIKNGLTERYEDCLDVVCSSIENDKLKCPHDSKPIIIDPSVPNTILYGNTLTDNALSNHHPRFPRSRIRREDNEHQRELCCPYKKCICRECKVAECKSKNHTAIIKVLNENTPGSCCPTYECEEKPDCKIKENGYTWLEQCARCECHDKEFVCHETCPEQESNSCVEGTKMYMNGDHWKRDACTECYCNNGLTRCKLPLCPQLSCHKTIQLQNSCCPDCDKTNSSFCPGLENCGIACKHDYLKSDDGCFLCKCAQYKTTTVNTTIYSSTTTTELPSTVISIDKNKFDDTIKRDNQSNYLLIIIIIICGFILIPLCVFGIYKVSQNIKNKKKYDRVVPIPSSASDTSQSHLYNKAAMTDPLN